MGTVPGDGTGGCGREQRGGVSLGDNGVGVMRGAAAIEGFLVELVETGQVGVSLFVSGLMKQGFARRGLAPGGLCPVVTHGGGRLNARGRRRQDGLEEGRAKE